MASMADILGKKPSFQAIRQRLSHAWDETFSNIETNSTDYIEAGDFRIDVAARSATVCGEELHLSRAEFEVLVYLISHRKQVVTPHTVLTTKSDGAGLCEAEFLPALLSLRKKLREHVPGAQYIRTEAWMLYDFHPAA